MNLVANGNLTTVSRVTGHKTLSHTLQRDFKLNKYKYLIILPIIVYLVLFAYKPMYGLIIAFKDYKRTKQGKQ